MQRFKPVLLNTLIANVTSSFLWFALTFWIYLETKSVLATAVIGGGYMLMMAIGGMVWGLVVDRHHKHRVMALSSTITLTTYALAGGVYLVAPKGSLTDWTHPLFWVFALLILAGGVVENMRNIALSTTVTILVEPDQRDRANGMVGTVQGVAFMVTSVFSGLAIGQLGMGWTLVIAIAFTAAALAHLATISIPEPEIVQDPSLKGQIVDFAGSIAAIRIVPGLWALIAFSCFNNLVGGVFMALMDPYGLTLFSVEAWGVVLGVTSIGFIVGGGIIAKKGLGANPLRTLLLVNVGVALLGALFAIREWWWLYAIGIFLFMCLMPWAEAAEQTIIQKVVPLERQGRVFGFAQSVEVAASPVSAFVVGPLAQFVLIPWMNTDAGRGSLGWLLGDGQARGIALVFLLASLVMLVVVLGAFASRPYRTLSRAYADHGADPAPEAEPVHA
ncbi:MFS transporter [Mariniluteicoccus flavus]